MAASMAVGGGRPDGSPRWKTLSHHGVVLPPPYPQVAGDVLWSGRPVSLSVEARWFAAEFVRRGGALVPVTRTRRQARLFGSAAFAAAFWEDWRRLLPRDCPISSLDDARLDLSRLLASPPPPLQNKMKAAAAAAAAPHPQAMATVDGVAQPVAPFAVDRPGIFAGRPGSTLTGRIRRRVAAADVTLNLGPGAPTPAGGPWGGIVRDPRVDWVARWRDPLTRIVKYARLAPASSTEQGAAKERFELARRAHARLPAFRRHVAAALGSSDRRRRQLGACLWLIERLALRVGSGSPASARARGAHGAANLFTDHVVALGPKRLRLDFPGKDGVRYVRTLDAARDASFGPAVRVLLGLLPRKGGAAVPLFDRIGVDDVAEAIDRLLLPGATAKVLRTARASATFEEALHTAARADATAPAILAAAGARVAALCNHRRKANTSSSNADLADVERRLEAAGADPKKVAEVVRAAGLSLATSRANYIDPRLVFAYCRRTDGCKAAFGPALQRRFAWAAATPASFQW